MRYELGIAASIMAMVYCFQRVSIGGDRNMFWYLFIYHFLTIILLMGICRMVGFGKVKFFSADNAWVSFCLSFLGISSTVVIWAIILKLLFI